MEKLVAESLNEFARELSGLEQQIVSKMNEIWDLAEIQLEDNYESYQEFLEFVAEDLDADVYIPEDIYEDLLFAVNPTAGGMRPDASSVDDMIDWIDEAGESPDMILPDILELYETYLTALQGI